MNIAYRISRRSPQLHRSSGLPRRGSVLVVVLALLSALMLLGFLFFTLASQERENARYFTASEKFYGPAFNADEAFDFALEQIIVGPRDDYANSALWGGRYSLLASLVGDDIQPYSGPGVNVVDDTELTTPFNSPTAVPGYPVVDQNRDGDALDGVDAQEQLALNLAEWTIATGDPNVRGFFAQPDVGYSYPDINSPFLAYIGKEPTTGNTIIIPSYHRPQYLRGLFDGSVAPADWYTAPATGPYVLRPHADRKIRKFDYGTGSIVQSPFNRFTDATVVRHGTFNEGYWTWDGTPASAAASGFHELDVDADKDGVKEAVLVDLDHPVEETPDGTQKFIPLYAITLYDLDGLLNLNAHGNLYGDAEDLANVPAGLFGGGDFVSRSNDGRRRYQVNPQLALDAGTDANPGVGAAHTNFFQHSPANAIELANMELWFLLAGRVDYDAAGTGIESYHLGRWGEQVRLDAAYRARSSSAYDYSRPGESPDPARNVTGDENLGTTADGNRGLAFLDLSGLFPRSILFPAPAAPEDNQGQGTYVDAATGKVPLLQRLIYPGNATFPAGGQGRVRTLAYSNYWLPTVAAAAPNNNLVVPLWWLSQNVTGFTQPLVTLTSFGVRTAGSPYNTALTVFPYGPGDIGRLVDDPGETLLDPLLARDQATDSIFGADEAAFLHLDGNDPGASYGIVSRLLNLVPANFRDSTNAAERRKRFTTVSSDLKSYTLSPGRMRDWETRQDLAGSSTAAELEFANVFPPLYGPPTSTVDVFRPEARGMLQQLDQFLVRQNAPNVPSSYDSDVLKGLIRKLSVNHVAASYVTDRRDQRPRFVLRPVTPHPLPGSTPQTTLTGDAIPVPTIEDAQGNVLAAGTARPYFGVSDELLTLNGLSTRSLGAPPIATGFATGGLSWPAAAQEWYARRDRQNLARDIYTLLYTLGHVNPLTNVTTTPNTGGAVYSDDQLREMAQFAVNLVDAMDPDDTVTAFVYDKNLVDGYTLKDDGYVDQPPYDPATRRYEDAERGMVFGVEMQKLAFSEALAVFARKYVEPPATDGTPHAATQWDDTKHRDFVYVELQNMTPLPVGMNGGWSISLVPNAASVPMVTPTPRSLTINDGSLAPPGGTYTVGVAGDRHNDQNGNPLEDSVMRVDPNSGASGALPDPIPVVAPALETASPGILDFDPLVAATDNSMYRVNDFDPTQPWGDGQPVGEPGPFDDPDSDGAPPDPKAGVWLDLGDQTMRDEIVDGSLIPIRISLRRRLNLNRAVPDQVAADSFQDAQKDNPWIEVDVIEVPLKVMSFASGDAAAVQTALETRVISSKRREPLDRTDELVAQGERATSQYQQNNLGGYHADDIATGASVWQRHFDRSLASLADVLNVPLYGPGELTDRVTQAGGAAAQDQTSIAAARILFPETEPRLMGTAGVPLLSAGNLWYRLFEFLEVPQKYGDDDGLPWFAHYGGPSPWGVTTQENLRLREFGKLNLNTMRHPHVLGGLLDDPRVMNLASGSLPTTNAEDWLTADDRDWWQSMLASRDGGFDPFSRSNFTQDIVLPGVPSSKPFVGFGESPAGNTAPFIQTAFNRTLLRTLPVGTTINTPEAGLGRRSLFELGEFGGSSPGVIGSNAEFATRYRLLGKVLNHGTTRSNTYVAFITCDFYDATAIDDDGDPITPDVFQIGARLPADGEDPANPEPRYRGVFVIDRTLALEMLSRRDLPPNDPSLKWPPGPNNNVYSTFSFARERGSDGRPTPTFDWKQLVQYRRVLKAQ